ncbi:MAG TPA: replication-relaxation family protein, partial [Solirubrobacteraceae bacterium]
LAVNDVGIAFVQAARQREDECGPLSWRHEIAHPISPARPRRPGELLVADALLTYIQADGEQSIVLHQRFIELDRGTLPAEQLAAKFTRYARLREYRPATKQAGAPARPLWTAYYRSFPSVLVVLADQTDAGARRRIQRTIALHNTDPERERHGSVPTLFVTLADLAAHGPFAPVFIDLQNPGRYVDWLGPPQAEEE